VSTETTTKDGNGKATRKAAETALAALPKPVAAHGAETSPVKTDIDIRDRTLWLCRMPYGGSRMLAAAFCSIGLDARVPPTKTPVRSNWAASTRRETSAIPSGSCWATT